ncbi:prepilin peptidase [Chitinilyticum aquatile]|uniref:prepilin peptidase n=1 Tax=Chitinilyticum aquatile TaxID=362520 RepID=UPI00048C1274|nr:A24 family peptidase [Chitinilyticum aquatile]
MLMEVSHLSLPVIVGLLGLCIGSFLNVVIHRLPLMMEQDFRHECACLDLDDGTPLPAPPRYNLMVPRSACPKCGHQISALENIPVLSWLWLRGRCRSCNAPISARYPLVELITACASTLLAWHLGPQPALLGSLLFVWILIALTLIDLDCFLLPDSLTLGLLWIGLLFNLSDTYTSLSSAVIGAVAGYLLLWSVYWAFRLATGKEGMGFGDFKLLAALGAWLGWQSLPSILLIASLSGAVIGIITALGKGRSLSKPIPFGPYLALAGIITMFAGPQIQQLVFPI